MNVVRIGLVGFGLAAAAMCLQAAAPVASDWPSSNNTL